MQGLSEEKEEERKKEGKKKTGAVAAVTGNLSPIVDSGYCKAVETGRRASRTHKAAAPAAPAAAAVATIDSRLGAAPVDPSWPRPFTACSDLPALSFASMLASVVIAAYPHTRSTN